MANKSYRGRGKYYVEDLKILKKLCIRYFGIGFLFSTPRIRCVLLESMNDFINDLIN